MTIIGILIAILVLGILIFVHELGHFLMAKSSGIAVDEFAVGFGKELIGWQRGETRYRLNLIPLGGYCKMRGEESGDRKSKEDKLKEAIADEPVKKDIEKDPHAMYNRPAWARVLAILGGPVFNYLFAIILFSLLFMAGLKENREDFTINIVATNSDGTPTPTVLAGLQDGDRLLNINGKDVINYSVVMEQFGLNANVPLKVVYERNGVTNETSLTPIKSPERGLGFAGLYKVSEPVVRTVDKKSPAEKAGFQTGDIVLQIQGNSVSSLDEIGLYITNENEKYNVLIDREGKHETLVVSPEKKSEGLYLGISPSKVSRRKASSFFNAFALGFVETNITLKEKIWFGLKKMFSGNLDVQKNISGPIRIVQITSKVAMYSDFNRLIQFMALISVALGFFNLLPIPGLDGGHFLINLFELVTTIKPSEKVMMVIEYVGFFIIIGLSILVVGNDLFNIIRDAIRGQ